MTDADLRSRLASLRPPAPSESARSRALFRACLTRENSAGARPAVHHCERLAPGLPLLAPLVAVLLLLPLFRTDRDAPISQISATSRLDIALLDELQRLFPGQLDAVIERGGSLQLELGSTPVLDASPADQALLLELTRGTHRLRILAYSGRTVRLRIDHRELRFSPLITGSGQVMLAGDDFAWNPAVEAPPRALDGWQIHARSLGGIL